MTPEQHRRVGELYREALELPPDQRSLFLSDPCHPDADLLREVESLLCHAARGDTIIDRFALQVLGEAIAVEQSQSWVGRQVSHYRILSSLGRGGMGEIYRAHDIRLGRDVAIKALPFVYSADPARLQRFEQEARAAGQLNHPNVLTVYDFGVHAGTPFIVAELLDGQDLRQHLNEGAVPYGRTIDYAQQIARGLAATHAKEILHRDLKPENLFVTNDGRVKILDFGLAKLTAPPAADALSSGPRLVSSPGLVVGTVGYLSPEQLRGEQADHRADVFAFGVILYEMLTGGRPFEGNSPADVTAAILKEEPPDLNETSRAIAPALNKIVRRCLEKNPERRFQSASDLCFAVDLLSSTSIAVPEVHSAPTPPRRAVGAPGRARWRLPAVALLTALIGAAISGTAVWKLATMMPGTPQPTARFVLPVPTAEVVSDDLDVSPDGAYLAYSTGRAGGKKLYLHNLASPGVAPPAEIEGGDGPFFSPDSQWLGFFAGGKMKKISVHGGTPIALADAPANSGADWGEHGSIVFAPIARAGLFTVSENGGVPEALTTPDAERSETSHVRPRWLPGNKAIVYVARTEAEAGKALVALSLKERRRNVLVRGADFPRFVSTGHLAYLEGAALKAVPLDQGRLAIAGTPIVMVEGVTAYGVSDTGTLIHAPSAPSGVPGSRLVWVDRRGSTEPLGAPARAYANPRLSPEGRRLAVSIANTPDNNIWIYDLARDSFAQLTFQGRNGWPVWNRDGRYVIYASNRAGTTWDIYKKSADGTGSEEPLLIKPFLQIPHNLPRDGRFLGLSEISTASVQTSLLSMSDSTLTAGITNGWTPSLSPDGRWVAYVSNEAGRYEIYVRPMSGTEGKWLISTDGGVEPLWSASGAELFYRRGDQVLAVDVVTRTAFEYGKPRVLFEGRYRLGGVNWDDTRNYDVTVDGQRFLMLEDTTPPVRTHLNVVVNWFNDLERLVATRK